MFRQKKAGFVGAVFIALFFASLVVCESMGYISEGKWRIAGATPTEPVERVATRFDLERASMGVLLMRLQEFQTRLETIPGKQARLLSVSLFELSLNVRTLFDGRLDVSFDEFTASEREIYFEILVLVQGLDSVMNLADDSNETVSSLLFHSGRYSTVMTATLS